MIICLFWFIKRMIFGGAYLCCCSFKLFHISYKSILHAIISRWSSTRNVNIVSNGVSMPNKLLGGPFRLEFCFIFALKVFWGAEWWCTDRRLRGSQHIGPAQHIHTNSGQVCEPYATFSTLATELITIENWE